MDGGGNAGGIGDDRSGMADGDVGGDGRVCVGRESHGDVSGDDCGVMGSYRAAVVWW